MIMEINPTNTIMYSDIFYIGVPHNYGNNLYLVWIEYFL